MTLFPSTLRTARLSALLLIPAGLLLGCTDLKENPTSLITKDTFYKNSDEVIAGLASVYANLRSDLDDIRNLNQVSTEEMVVPVRGSDWFDNGAWLDLHRQSWTPTSAVGLREVNGIWNAQYAGVARANVVLEALDKVTIPDQAIIKAELRALRAFYYMNLMDVYGGVPVATDTKVEARPAKTRAEVFAFIEAELKAARADLPKTWASQQGRLTQGAADAMLASLYINARIWSGTPTATGITLGAAKWTEASAAADAVINSGTYSLAVDGTRAFGSGYKSNFVPSNQSSPEIIMTVRSKAVDGLGLRQPMFSGLHYNSGISAWNGWSIVAETYRKFDPADIRRSAVLAGPQVDIFTGTPVNDRAGNRLVFSVDIADITAATEGEGTRLYKWPVDPANAGGFSGNDYPLYRLAEMYLIKAEAQNELNNQAGAIQLLNTVRARAFSPAKPIAAGLDQATVRGLIFDERLFELLGEGKHRQDQIRAGTYTSGTWFGHTPAPAYKAILPIPQSQLNTNPSLKQNPGY